MKPDIVWWWSLQERRWLPASYATATSAEIRRMGYVTVEGWIAQGPPQIQPSDEQRARALMRRNVDERESG